MCSKLTLETIISKLGFDPFDKSRIEQLDETLDDSYNPYDILTDEEVHFLALEAIRRMNVEKANQTKKVNI